MARIEVKVRRFSDRRLLQLQYFDADGRRRTQSARTADEQAQYDAVSTAQAVKRLQKAWGAK